MSHVRIALVTSFIAAALVAQEPSFDFSLPPQPVSQILAALAKQTGLQLAFPREAVQGLQSPGVVGRHSLPEALALALKGTGLTYEFTGDKAVRVQAVAGATVVVTGRPEAASMLDGAVVSGESLATQRTATSDSARLLEGLPGLSFYAGGGVSSLPVIDGLADDRLRLLVDGLSITSSCPNHMNPALSYLDPGAVASVSVFAGIAPVSVGGDSIGGTIVLRSADPVFAEPGSGSLASGRLSAFFRSNGNVAGANARGSFASDSLSIAYVGSTVKAGDYKDGSGELVRSTEYKAVNHQVTLATRFGQHLLSLDVGAQDIPYQGYANQFMDMTSNKSVSLNARYLGDFAWGQFEARAFRQRVRHKMDMLTDKANLGVLTNGMPYVMPMDTEGIDAGYSLQANVRLSPKDVIRLGQEYHRYTLDDWWPPVAGMEGMMGPNTFWNIHGGKRERLAVFGEWEARFGAWSTQLGARVEHVAMDTGAVQGYYSTMDLMGMAPDGSIYQVDADAFNARDHKRNDTNLDLTAVSRYEPDATSAYEFGAAQKTRSPNLYERYAWSNEAGMAGAMISWFGDLNAYVGNLDLKPEVAHTFRASADWHDSARQDWQLKVAPFYTRVRDFINVEPNLATTYPAPSGRVALRFVNRDAKLYGVDLSARKRLGEAAGEWALRLVGSSVRGQDVDGGHDLYNIMPLNGRLGLEHSLGGWSSSLEWQSVAAKDRVDTVRQEFKTPGYSILNFRTRYVWGHARLDAGIDNLLNKQYGLPLGGMDFYVYNYLSPATQGHLAVVRGMGRSVSVGLTVSY
ncbi:TonB-dependent receptor [Geothrix sp. PMB-07]|uniref:TonB-dependent receptor domain-containing protein n=1 Tax=Geothrix sp. PMB-07 TaxID=3068640 RepID=UPI002740C2F7|nr:TonB-dependent receptor [Geothrix sp. PMB-07]WLT31922.1 TonB-dependent receptor [Geothrix sp. PMB-07]